MARTEVMSLYSSRQPINNYIFLYYVPKEACNYIFINIFYRLSVKISTSPWKTQHGQFHYNCRIETSQRQ